MKAVAAETGITTIKTPRSSGKTETENPYKRETKSHQQHKTTQTTETIAVENVGAAAATGTTTLPAPSAGEKSVRRCVTED